MSHPDNRVVRVLSNNAVLAACATGEVVLVGRGIGFGRKVGDPISTDATHRRYLALSDEQAAVVRSMSTLDPFVTSTIATSIDLAADLLGELHPSVYVVLVEHLAAALERLERGDVIHNGLTTEISAVFGAEYQAAELIVRYLNTHLDQEFPVDEAGFIALHLVAARTGDTVRTPLATANELGQITEFVRSRLAPRRGADSELAALLTSAISRLRTREWRDNDARDAIAAALPEEYALATEVLAEIVHAHPLPAAAVGEAAYLAVSLHGWRHGGGEHNSITPFTTRKEQP